MKKSALRPYIQFFFLHCTYTPSPLEHTFGQLRLYDLRHWPFAVCVPLVEYITHPPPLAMSDSSTRPPLS